MTRHLLGVVLVAILASFPATARAAETFELPQGLWESLGGRSLPVVVWVDWQAIASLPEIRRVLDDAQEDDDVDLLAVGPALRAVFALAPIRDDIQEIWVAKKHFRRSYGEMVWARTDLDADSIAARFEASGWTDVTGRHQLYMEPAEMAAAIRLRQPPPADQAQQSESLALWTRPWQRVVVGPGGWLRLNPPGPAPISMGPLKTAAPDDFEELGLSFPFEGLVRRQRTSVAVLAVDLPENDDPGREKVQSFHEARLYQLEDRLRELSKTDEEQVLRLAGDVLLTATEVDGGIALDLDVRHPREVPRDLSVEVTRAGLLLLRLMLFWSSPDLADELADSLVSRVPLGVHASVVVSHASLWDSVDAWARREKAMQDLENRIEKLQLELGEP